MKAALERKIVRWFHILTSIPVIGYIYGLVAGIPQTAFAIKMIIFPAIVFSGFWLGLEHKIGKYFNKSL